MNGEIAVYLIVVAVGITLTVAVIVQWRAARKVMGDVRFLHEQLQRALRQIESRDAEEIRAGLQTLSMLNHLRFRLRALERMRTLREHENVKVAREAGKTYDDIVRGLERAAE